jgi:hypothetical protein
MTVRNIFTAVEKAIDKGLVKVLGLIVVKISDTEIMITDHSHTCLVCTTDSLSTTLTTIENYVKEMRLSVE